jgi:putative zinc finger protein
MTMDCSNFRNLIPRALLSDLTRDEQEALEAHFKECAPCAQERDLYLNTLGQLRSAEDVPVPRHFFIYPDEGRPTLWQLFAQLSLAWKGSLAAAFLALAGLSALALTSMEIRGEPGGIVFRIGKPPVPVAARPAPTIDVKALKSELVRLLEDRSRNDRLEILQTLRVEMARSESALSRKQRLMLETALSRLESRVNHRIVDTAASLESANQRSLGDMYRTLETQRVQDLSSVNDRLNRITVNGEIKGNQTDAILETLLQVAELKLK